MKTRALTVALLLSASSQAFSQDDDFTAQHILVVAKMTGACGILSSLISFQEKTQMPGGDDFVSRFWAVEAARLGKTVEELAKECRQSITLYNTLWEVSSEPLPQ